MSRSLWVAVSGVLFAVGCGDKPTTKADSGGGDGGHDATDAPDATTTTCEGPLTGDTYTYVLGTLVMAREDSTNPDLEGIVAGFNLDGRISDDSDALGCYQPDWISPPPDNEMGVDNQLGPVLGALSGADPSLDVQSQLDASIAAGDLIMLVQIAGVNDLNNDSCVELTVLGGRYPKTSRACTTTCEAGWTCYRASVDAGVDGSADGGGSTAGTCVPAFSAGKLAGGQSFAIDPSSYEPGTTVPRASAYAHISGGRLRTETITLPLPIPLGGDVLELVLMEAQLRVSLAADEASFGVIGGGLDVVTLTTTLKETFPMLPGGIIDSIFNAAADLDPDEMGACQTLSVGLSFTGVDAVVVAGEAAPDAGPSDSGSTDAPASDAPGADAGSDLDGGGADAGSA